MRTFFPSLLIICGIVTVIVSGHVEDENDYYRTWYDDVRQKCTSIGAGRLATVDGAT